MVTSNVRIPEEIWEEVRNIAIEDERSMNSEIIFILKKYVEERKSQDKNKEK